MFTIKELHLMRRLCDDFENEQFSKDEEKKIYKLRNKICDLITLKQAWNRGHRINDCNDYCRGDNDV